MDTLTELKKLKEGYESAQKRLNDYSSGLKHQINIPICSVAFIQGSLKNPNEVFICLSPELTLKSDLQGSTAIISKKLAGLNSEISQLEPKAPEPVEKVFEKLKILEEQEKLTPCLGEIVEKTEQITVKPVLEEHKSPAANTPAPKLSKFKQEMQSRKG